MRDGRARRRRRPRRRSEAAAREENTADLAADGVPPALAAWLDDGPRSERETAFVQPAYEPRPECLGQLACRRLRASLLTAGTLGYLWVEWLLWLAVGEAVPDRVPGRARAFLAGSAVAFAVLSVLLFAVWATLFHQP